jgi:hypothetical protein
MLGGPSHAVTGAVGAHAVVKVSANSLLFVTKNVSANPVEPSNPFTVLPFGETVGANWAEAELEVANNAPTRSTSTDNGERQMRLAAVRDSYVFVMWYVIRFLLCLCLMENSEHP